MRTLRALFEFLFSGSAKREPPRLTIQTPVDGPHTEPIQIVRITCSTMEAGPKIRKEIDGTDQYPCFKKIDSQGRAIDFTIKKALKLNFFSAVQIERGGSVCLGRNTSITADQRSGLFPYRDSIHNNISAKHFAVKYDSEGFLWIEDMKSSNGTSILRPDPSAPSGYLRLNLAPNAEIPLKVGDYILLCNEHLLQVQLAPDQP